MRFFRRRSSPALVILLAFAMQAAAVLAHAHVHPHPPTRSGVHGWTKSAALACRALVRPPACAPVAPGHQHDDCPLCWSLTASGVGVLPSPVTVTATAAPMHMLSPPAATSAVAKAGASQFQPRGPPTA